MSRMISSSPSSLGSRFLQWWNKPGFTPQDKIAKIVKLWLVVGLVMIFIQVVVGGVTRLTGSGLSITKWEIVTGTLPPLSASQWDEAFDLYKGTPQYHKINKGMSMSEFKFIYFWEYIHRLWARSMGFIFLIPFLFFWRKGMFSKKLIKDLGIVFLLAGLVASFGWIMVASGLINRPLVNAYKLTMHLSLAFILYSYLLWTTFKVFYSKPKVIHNKLLKSLGITMLVILALQIFLGGVMSGMKAGLFYPTWPDIGGYYLPSVLFDHTQWTVDNFVNYEQSPLVMALFHFLHRNVAYLLSIIVLTYFFLTRKHWKVTVFKYGSLLLVSMLVIQVLLGIFTLINCIGVIPVGLGVLHQAGALVLLSIILFMNYQTWNLK